MNHYRKAQRTRDLETLLEYCAEHFDADGGRPQLAAAIREIIQNPSADVLETVKRHGKGTFVRALSESDSEGGGR